MLGLCLSGIEITPVLCICKLRRKVPLLPLFKLQLLESNPFPPFTFSSLSNDVAQLPSIKLSNL